MYWTGWHKFKWFEIVKLGHVYGGIKAQEMYFVETGAGTYTASVSIPAGAFVQDIIVYAEAVWDAATSATLKVGDGSDDDRYYTAVNLKATDLTAGQGLSFAHTGGKQGADVAVPGADTHILNRYSSSARTISAVATSVGAGSAGRTRVVVLYSSHTSEGRITATKV